MGFGLNFGPGIQRLINSRQKFFRSGHPVYLRRRNFVEPVGGSLFAELGFIATPVTGESGTWDILVSPPPSVRMVSMHNIAMSGGKLRFGARVFQISASFVDSQVDFHDIGTQMAFWRSPDILGLVTENLLFSVEDVGHDEIAGKSLMWLLTCNGNELR